MVPLDVLHLIVKSERSVKKVFAGRSLKHLREERGMTREELVPLTELSARMIRTIEENRSKVDWDQLVVILGAGFGMPLHDIDHVLLEHGLPPLTMKARQDYYHHQQKGG